MDNEEKIRRRMDERARLLLGDATLLGKVSAVNESEEMCSITDDETGNIYAQVRLSPVINGEAAMMLVPKVGAWALAVRIEDSEDWMLVLATKVSKVVMNADTVMINNGTNGGLVKWNEVKTELDKVKQFINAVKTLPPVTEPGNGASSAFQTALNSALSSIQNPDFDNKANNNVKH